MKWCVECGAVGKPEPAVTTHEGDPLCAGCAKARGVAVEKPVFNAEFIDRRMAEHKAPPATPSAPKEKVMATKLCACGCGTDLTGSSWNYVRGHKKAHLAGADVPSPKAPKSRDIAVAKAVPEVFDLFPIDLLWDALPMAHKKQALKALLDSIL